MTVVQLGLSSIDKMNCPLAEEATPQSLVIKAENRRKLLILKQTKVEKPKAYLHPTSLRRQG